MSDHLKRQTPLSQDEAACGYMKTAWLEGHSAGEIAAEISRKYRNYSPTRNVIIGIIARKGWKRSPEVAKLAGVHSGKAAARATPPRPPARPKPVPAAPRAVVERRIPNPDNLPAALPPGTRTGPTLLQLTSNQCRSPVGPDTRESGQPQMFCGRLVGYRSVEVRKGVFQERQDVYCGQCAKRNRIGLVSSLSARQRHERSMRAFA